MGQTVQVDAAELARLRATAAKAEEAGKKARERNFQTSFKVGDKGGMVVKGLGQRFPVTLYAEGWDKMIQLVESGELKRNLEALRPKLKKRED